MLATISIQEKEGNLEIRFENREALRIAVNKLDEFFVTVMRVQVWESQVDALVAPDAVNQWFSEVIGTEYFLSYMPDESERAVNDIYNKGNDIVSFADAYPLLLTNRASLAGLNSRLDVPVPMERFRPNIVVAGAEAFEEDRWKRIRIGKAEFRVAKPCARCVVTTIDQKSGWKHAKEPLKALAGFRKASYVYPNNYENRGLGSNDILFGMNLIPETFDESIAVGDDVQLLD